MISVLLSLGVVFFSLLLIVPLGGMLGYIQARREYRGKLLVDILVVLPLILPPSVVGYFLLLVLGVSGPIGSWLDSWLGIRLVFSFWGAVIAASVVAFPMMAKGAEAAFSRIDLHLEEAAAVDGATRFQTLQKITLPLASRGLLAAILLTAGRALGEFGATLMFAGNFAGRTNTLPLEIYNALSANDDRRAFLLAIFLTIVSAAVAFVLSRASRSVI